MKRIVGLLMALLVAQAGIVSVASAAGLDLSKYKGKQAVYIDFWASWCVPCRESFPWLNKMNSQYGDKGLKVIGVNLDAELEEASAFLKLYPAEFDVVYDPDGDIATKFDLQGMSTAVLIGRDGKISSQHIGFNSGRAALYEKAIKELLAEGTMK